MGLFGKKKEKVPDGIRMMFYDGELPGFMCNFPCQLLLTDEVLRITKINPYVEVNLERSRITSIDFYEERQYMQKFKGNAAFTSKSGETSYYVVNYISKDGMGKHLDFWADPFSGIKMMKMIKEFMKSQKSTSYEI